MKKKESIGFTLMDFDGDTVKKMKEFLDTYDDDAVIDVREGFTYGFGSNDGEFYDYFVIVEKEGE